LQDEGAVPRPTTRPVVVGLDHLDTRGIVHQVNFIDPDVHPHSHRIFPRNQGQAGNVAHEHLGAEALAMGSVRIEAAMGGKDPLVEHIVEANAYFEVARWLAEWK